MAVEAAAGPMKGKLVVRSIGLPLSGDPGQPILDADTMAIDVRVPDAPCANEIVVCVAVTDSGRSLPGVGGLKKRRDQGSGWVAMNPPIREADAEGNSGCIVENCHEG